jgi:hypothetical protein
LSAICAIGYSARKYPQFRLRIAPPERSSNPSIVSLDKDDQQPIKNNDADTPTTLGALIKLAKNRVSKRPTIIGNAPVDAMRQALKKPAAPGRVVISAIALEHARRDHPEDFEEVVSILGKMLERPSYYSLPQMGDAGMTIAYYYVILDEGGRAIVLPVSTDQNNFGEYQARSFYIASAKTIESRLKKGKIFRVKKYGV